MIGKSIMVKNYKRPNDNLEFNGYFIPNKAVLLNYIRDATPKFKMPHSIVNVTANYALNK